MGHDFSILGQSDLPLPPILPSNQNPLGALPARFRRPRVLIVGFGDVGVRAARLLTPRVRVLAIVREAARAGTLRAQGVTPLLGDLDDAASLRRLAGIATRVIHLAPPPAEGEGDPRSAALLRALARRTAPLALVYASTSGVYGDCGGAWVGETRAANPRTARARARVAAEQAIACPLLEGVDLHGARGMLAMREAGARNVVQDEKTSVVWGMPGAAANLGAADKVLPLHEIADQVLEWVAERVAPAAARA